MAGEKTASSTITDVVFQRLKEAGAEIISGKVIDVLVDREVTKRADALTKVIDLIDQERRNLNKINRADIQSFTAEGKVATENYSKSRLQEINNLKKRMSKMEAVVEKALVKDDFGDLYAAAAGKIKDDPAPAEGDSGSES